MAGPEYQPQQQPEQGIQQVPEQAEIPREVEQATGVQATPQHAQQLTDDQGQVVAQPVPTPPSSTGPMVTIPAHSEEELEKMSHGKPQDAQTWFGVYWLYRIHKAIRSGIQAVFSN